jgi:FkbM family methyltransferase
MQRRTAKEALIARVTGQNGCYLAKALVMSRQANNQFSISSEIKGSVRRTLRYIGLDLVRWRPQSSAGAALARMLNLHRIDTVLDVGANEGQYAHWLRELGFTGRIISFEPLAVTHQRLQQAAVKDALWTIAPRTALGDREGTLLMHIAANSVSSSALPMLDGHVQAAPESVYIGSETVPITRLDTAVEEMLVSGQNLFLKIDVQGFEPKVLEGASRLLDRILGVQLELSLVPLYDGETLFLSLIDFMARKGFELWSLIPNFVDKETGRTLQVDGIFFRNDARSNTDRAIEEVG